MCEEVQLHAKLFDRVEFSEDLGDVLSRLDGYFGIEGDPFREEVDAQDDENKQYPASDSDFFAWFHVLDY